MLTSAKDARESIEKEKEAKAKKIADTKASQHEHDEIFEAFMKSIKEVEATREKSREKIRRAFEEEEASRKKYEEEQKNKPPRDRKAEARAWFEQQVKYAIKCCNSSFTYITLSDCFTEDSMDLIIDEIKAAGYIVKKDFINHDDDPEFDSTFGTKEMRYTFIIPE